MAVDRRTLLKTLAVSAALPYLDLGIARALVANPPPPSKVYILLHGLFFLEFDGNSLWVATPKHAPHQVCVRRHGETQPHTLAQCDLILNQLQPGSKRDFPAELVKFPKSGLGASSAVLSHAQAQNYYCRMQFPHPDDILPLRKAPKEQFCPCPSTNIGTQLSYGANVATITCLVYSPGSGGPYVESYYAEHRCRPNVDDVNAALISAQSLCGNAFDLQMVNCNPPVAKPDPDGSLPDGVSSDDEKGLPELLGHCPAIGTKAHRAAGGKAQAESLSPQPKSSQGNGCVKSQFCCDPSDCPQLGIT